ncbi:hypothetical protein HOLleu_17427 [Holothuria leucospilota]|uniref:Uncharacterized protein n=1 Tax=Holothuria leucospilota TaxID=206669 RepID=A0A9Q1C262_HOLLE|nr:hypothetical protein HOLleu_17427 [Holothuria leucospilota]
MQISAKSFTLVFEKDLGLVITGNLKPSRQCAAAAARANRVLGLIKRNFNSFSKEIVLNLYAVGKTPSRLSNPSRLCSTDLSPFYEWDKFLLEQLQRTATHLIPEVRRLPYHVRLKHLGFSLGPIISIQYWYRPILPIFVQYWYRQNLPNMPILPYRCFSSYTLYFIKMLHYLL